MADVCRDTPSCSEHEAFEGWAIQKLAGLQLLIEMLNANLNRLGAEMERRTGGGTNQSAGDEIPDTRPYPESAEPSTRSPCCRSPRGWRP